MAKKKKAASKKGKKKGHKKRKKKLTSGVKPVSHAKGVPLGKEF
jgi:hypothetical protein